VHLDNEFRFFIIILIRFCTCSVTDLKICGAL